MLDPQPKKQHLTLVLILSAVSQISILSKRLLNLSYRGENLQPVRGRVKFTTKILPKPEQAQDPPLRNLEPVF